MARVWLVVFLAFLCHEDVMAVGGHAHHHTASSNHHGRHGLSKTARHVQAHLAQKAHARLKPHQKLNVLTSGHHRRHTETLDHMRAQPDDHAQLEEERAVRDMDIRAPPDAAHGGPRGQSMEEGDEGSTQQRTQVDDCAAVVTSDDCKKSFAYEAETSLNYTCSWNLKIQKGREGRTCLVDSQDSATAEECACMLDRNSTYVRETTKANTMVAIAVGIVGGILVLAVIAAIGFWIYQTFGSGQVSESDCGEGSTTTLPLKFVQDEKFFTLNTETTVHAIDPVTKVVSTEQLGRFTSRRMDGRSTITYHDKNGKIAAFMFREIKFFSFSGQEKTIILCDHKDVKWEVDEGDENVVSNIFSFKESTYNVKRDGEKVGSSEKSDWGATILAIKGNDGSEVAHMERDLFNWGTDHWAIDVKIPALIEPVIMGFTSHAVSVHTNQKRSRQQSSALSAVGKVIK